MPLKIDVSSLEGWFIKKRGPNKQKVLSILSSDTKRWFKVKELVSYNRLEMALCYYKTEHDLEARGWMYMRDIIDLRDNGDTITIVSLARSITIEAKNRAVHELWFKSVSSLCPSLRNAAGQDKLQILANDGYRRRNGSTATSSTSTNRAIKDEKETPASHNTYRRESTVAESKESAHISISDSPRSNRDVSFKRSNDHQEYVRDEHLNLDGDRNSGKGLRQSFERSSSRPRISSSGSIQDRHDQLDYEPFKSRPKSSTTPLRIDTMRSTDSVPLDERSHDLLVRSARRSTDSDYDDDTETLNITYESSKCRRSRSTDYRAKDTKHIDRLESDRGEITHKQNYPPSGSAATAYSNTYCDSPTDLIEDVGEAQEFPPHSLPLSEDGYINRLRNDTTDDRHRAGIKQPSKTVSEKSEPKAPVSRDRPPLCPPGSALNPYVAPGKLPSSFRAGNVEPKNKNLPIDSTYHDWDEDDDRRDIDYLSEAERRSRVNSLRKESESDREDSRSRVSGGVDADSDWLANNFDEE